MKKTAAILALVLLLLTAAVLTGCSNEDNSEIVGEWKPSTVSINGTTISYSDLDTKGKDFSFNFYPTASARSSSAASATTAATPFTKPPSISNTAAKAKSSATTTASSPSSSTTTTRPRRICLRRCQNKLSALPHYTGQSRQNRDGTLCCDDLTRENGNLEKAESMRKSCEENGWTAVSMKDDWTTIYGDGVTKK